MHSSVPDRNIDNKMKKILFVILTASLLLSSSCVDREDVSLGGISNVSLNLPTGATFDVIIENRSAHKLKVLSGNVDIMYRGRKAGTIMLAEEVEVPRRFSGNVPVRLRLRISDIVAGYAAMTDLQNGGKNLTVSGEAQVKAGWASKKIAIQDEPVSRFMSSFAQLTDSLR